MIRNINPCDSWIARGSFIFVNRIDNSTGAAIQGRKSPRHHLVKHDIVPHKTASSLEDTISLA